MVVVFPQTVLLFDSVGENEIVAFGFVGGGKFFNFFCRQKFLDVPIHLFVRVFEELLSHNYASRWFLDEPKQSLFVLYVLKLIATHVLVLVLVVIVPRHLHPVLVLNSQLDLLHRLSKRLLQLLQVLLMILVQVVTTDQLCVFLTLSNLTPWNVTASASFYLLLNYLLSLVRLYWNLEVHFLQQIFQIRYFFSLLLLNSFLLL